MTDPIGPWGAALFAAIAAAVLLGDGAEALFGVNVWKRAKAALLPDPVEQARRDYASDRIGETEFHRQLELHLNDSTEKIRQSAERVNNVGTETSEEIALHFDTFEGYLNADREGLLAISGVGPQTADAILAENDRADD